MYTLHDYARMIADERRIAAYVRALEATVRPGSVVIDIGTGTGLLALVACRLGASRVYAIDTNPAIEVGRDLAQENQFSDRIEFIQQDALTLALPERGNVIVSDLRGPTPLAPGNLSVVAYARERFLAPGGVLIPQQDALRVAVVGSRARYAQALGPSDVGGITLGALQRALANEAHKDRGRSLQRGDLLTPPATWHVIDYRFVEPKPVSGSAGWIMDRSAVAHGLLLWFDTILFASDGFTTEPGSPGVYPQLFLPLTAPLALAPGDSIKVDLWAQADGHPWGWNTFVTAQDGSKKARFKQSTFLGTPGKPTRPSLRGGREAP